MPLNIGRVDAQINIESGSPGSRNGGAAEGQAGGASERVEDAELMARLRPMVIEILEQELTRFQRQQG